MDSGALDMVTDSHRKQSEQLPSQYNSYNCAQLRQPTHVNEMTTRETEHPWSVYHSATSDRSTGLQSSSESQHPIVGCQEYHHGYQYRQNSNNQYYYNAHQAIDNNNNNSEYSLHGISSYQQPQNVQRTNEIWYLGAQQGQCSSVPSELEYTYGRAACDEFDHQSRHWHSLHNSYELAHYENASAPNGATEDQHRHHAPNYQYATEDRASTYCYEQPIDASSNPTIQPRRPINYCYCASVDSSTNSGSLTSTSSSSPSCSSLLQLNTGFPSSARSSDVESSSKVNATSNLNTNVEPVPLKIQQSALVTMRPSQHIKTEARSDTVIASMARKESSSIEHVAQVKEPAKPPVIANRRRSFSSTVNAANATASAQNPVASTNHCHICGRNYARPSTLKTHMRTHTNERPFKCSVCHKTFSQAANLTAHQRVHTGERPFACPICGRQFSQSSSVITHLRTHSGERPYRCHKCNRTFSDSSTLTKHCRIHSGEKPYSCDYCPLNFSQSGNLSRHLRLHKSLPRFKTDAKPSASILSASAADLTTNYSRILSNDRVESGTGHPPTATASNRL